MKGFEWLNQFILTIKMLPKHAGFYEMSLAHIFNLESKTMNHFQSCCPWKSWIFSVFMTFMDSMMAPLISWQISHFSGGLIMSVLYLPVLKCVCVSLRYLHPGEDAVTGQRLPPSSPELRRRSRPAEQTQRDAAVHPLHGGHEAAVREVEVKDEMKRLCHSTWQHFNPFFIFLICG